MFSVDRAPRYVAETCAGAARLQEQTTPGQYAALVERAERLLVGMFRVETNVDPDLQVRIALREKFDGDRVKQAILLVATWQLIRGLSNAMSVQPAPGAAAVRPQALLAR
ncbi:MAG TPA: hypothetical protein VG457_19205 [Planctomycetota bacterium]|jgi:hypothetical protein|nr:hypothetical protein [Planctomycetota bacterium]